MLSLALSFAALAAEPVDLAVAAALADHPPDLPSCLATDRGEAVLMVGISADGKLAKVTVDHADANFPEDCGLSVLREVPFPAGERTIALSIRKVPGRAVVSYGPAVGDLVLEAATRADVVACALAHPGEAADAAWTRVSWGPSGKASSGALISGKFGGDGLQACVIDALSAARLPKASRGGAVIAWDTQQWTAEASR